MIANSIARSARVAFSPLSARRLLRQSPGLLIMRFSTSENDKKNTPKEEIDAPQPPPPPATLDEALQDPFPPESVLYKGKSEFSLRVMFSAGIFNVLYWSYYVTNSLVNEGVLVDGVPVVGDPKFGILGALGTAFIFASGYSIGKYSIRRIYQTSSDMIGFQMYNFFGLSGRRIETELGNARLTTFGKKDSDYYIKIGGYDRNLVLNRQGTFIDEEKTMNLLQETPKSHKPLSKEDVIHWRQSLRKNQNNKKRN